MPALRELEVSTGATRYAGGGAFTNSLIAGCEYGGGGHGDDSLAADQPLSNINNAAAKEGAIAMDRMVRNIARALSSAGIKIDDKASLKEIVDTVSSKIPNPATNGRTFAASEPSQRKVCKSLAIAFNNVFSKGATKSTDMFIDTTMEPENICAEVSRWVESFSLGVNTEFLAIHTTVRNTMRNVTTAKAVADAAINEMEAELIDASGDIPEEVSAKLESLRSYRVAAETETTKQLKLLENLMNVKLAPPLDEYISAMDTRSANNDVVNNISGYTIGSERFANWMALKIGRIAEITILAQKVNKALTSMGLQIDDYVSASSADSLNAKLEAVVTSGAPSKAAKLIKAKETLVSSFKDSANESIMLKLQEPKSGSGDDDQVAGGMVAPRKTIETRLKQSIAERNVVIKDFTVRIGDANKKLSEAIKVIGPKLGREIKLSALIFKLNRAVSAFQSINIDQIEYALVGVNTDAQARVKRDEALTAFARVSGICEEIASSPEHSASASYFLAIKTAIDKIRSTMEFFGKVVAEKYGGGVGDAELASVNLTSDSLNVSAIVREFKYFYYIASVRENLAKTSGELAEFGEEYEKTLGIAVAGCLHKYEAHKNAQLVAINAAVVAANVVAVGVGGVAPGIPGVGAGAGAIANAGSHPVITLDKINEEKIAATKRCENDFAIRKRFYGAVQAIDLYMKAFTSEIASNPDSILEIKQMLDKTQTIAKWFDEQTGNNLADAFDSFAVAPTAGIPTGGSHYYQMLDADTIGPTNIGSPVSGHASCKTAANTDSKIDTALKSYQGLKNLINAFARIGDEFGGTAIREQIFMSPTQIYTALVDYIQQAALVVVPSTLSTKFAIVGVDGVTATPHSEWAQEDEYFAMVVKAMASKILTTLGTYEMLTRETPLLTITPTRVIIGGNADSTIKIIPGAAELYFRMIRLLEFYSKIFNWSDKDVTNLSARTMTMIPDLSGRFAGIIKFMFKIATNANAASGQYSDAEIGAIIIEINAIYEHYKTATPDDITKSAIMDLVNEVNRRYGMVKKDDLLKFRQLTLGMYDSTTKSPSTQMGYAILPGETDGTRLLSGNARAPSDQWKINSPATQGAALAANDPLTLNGQDSFYTELSRFRDLIQANTHRTTNNHTSQIYAIKHAESQLTDIPQLKQFGVVSDLIRGRSSDSHDVQKNVMFHESVLVGLNTLMTHLKTIQGIEKAIDELNVSTIKDSIRANIISIITEMTPAAARNPTTWGEQCDNAHPPPSPATVEPYHELQWSIAARAAANPVFANIPVSKFAHRVTGGHRYAVHHQSTENIGRLNGPIHRSPGAVYVDCMSAIDRIIRAAAGANDAARIAAAIAALDNPDEKQMFDHFIHMMVDYDRIMEAFVELAFTASTPTDSGAAIDVRITKKQLDINFSSMRKMSESIMDDVKYFFNILRPQLSPNIVQTVIHDTAEGSIPYLEKYLFDTYYIEDGTSLSTSSANRTGRSGIDRLSDKIRDAFGLMFNTVSTVFSYQPPQFGLVDLAEYGVSAGVITQGPIVENYENTFFRIICRSRAPATNRYVDSNTRMVETGLKSLLRTDRKSKTDSHAIGTDAELDALKNSRAAARKQVVEQNATVATRRLAHTTATSWPTYSTNYPPIAAALINIDTADLNAAAGAAAAAAAGAAAAAPAPNTIGVDTQAALDAIAANGFGMVGADAAVYRGAINALATQVALANTARAATITRRATELTAADRVLAQAQTDFADEDESYETYIGSRTFASNGFYDFEGNFGSDRSLMLMYNQLIAKFLQQFTDMSAGSNKIYANLVDAFANGVESISVANPNKGYPDIRIGPKKDNFRPILAGIPKATLLQSLAFVLQRITKDANPSNQIPDHMVSTMTEVPTYIKEAMRAKLPAFIKLFDTLIHKCEFVKKFMSKSGANIEVNPLQSQINANAVKYSFAFGPDGKEIYNNWARMPEKDTRGVDNILDPIYADAFIAGAAGPNIGIIIEWYSTHVPHFTYFNVNWIGTSSDAALECRVIKPTQDVSNSNLVVGLMPFMGAAAGLLTGVAAGNADVAAALVALGAPADGVLAALVAAARNPPVDPDLAAGDPHTVSIMNADDSTRLGMLSDQIHDANASDVLPKFGAIIDRITEGTFSIRTSSDEVLKELGNSPVFCQLSDNSIESYRSRNSVDPLMPHSIVFSMLDDLTDKARIQPYMKPTNGDPDDCVSVNLPFDISVISPTHSQGTPEYKYAYGTRHMLTTVPVTEVNMPGVFRLLTDYNKTSSLDTQIDAKRFAMFTTRVTSTMRWVVDMRLVKSTISPCVLFSSKPYLPQQHAAAGTTTQILLYQSGDTKFGKSIAIVEDSDQRDTLAAISKHVASEDGEFDPVTTRAQQQVTNIVDLNIIPINVHAMMRDIPLANLYNYALTFDHMVETIHSQSDPGSQLFTNLMKNPFQVIPEQVYFGNSTRSIRAIFRGAIDNGMDRPKFLSDQLYGKVLFGNMLSAPRIAGRGAVVGGAPLNVVHQLMETRTRIAEADAVLEELVHRSTNLGVVAMDALQINGTQVFSSDATVAVHDVPPLAPAVPHGRYTLVEMPVRLPLDSQNGGVAAAVTRRDSIRNSVVDIRDGYAQLLNQLITATSTMSNNPGTGRMLSTLTFKAYDIGTANTATGAQRYMGNAIRDADAVMVAAAAVAAGPTAALRLAASAAVDTAKVSIKSYADDIASDVANAPSSPVDTIKLQRVIISQNTTHWKDFRVAPRNYHIDEIDDRTEFTMQLLSMYIYSLCKLQRSDFTWSGAATSTKLGFADGPARRPFIIGIYVHSVLYAELMRVVAAIKASPTTNITLATFNGYITQMKDALGTAKRDLTTLIAEIDKVNNVFSTTAAQAAANGVPVAIAAANDAVRAVAAAAATAAADAHRNVFPKITIFGNTVSIDTTNTSSVNRDEITTAAGEYRKRILHPTSVVDDYLYVPFSARIADYLVRHTVILQALTAQMDQEGAPLSAQVIAYAEQPHMVFTLQGIIGDVGGLPYLDHTDTRVLHGGNSNDAFLASAHTYGKERFDSRLIRRLFFITNVNRVLRQKLSRELVHDRGVVVSSHDAVAPGVTEFDRDPFQSGERINSVSMNHTRQFTRDDNSDEPYGRVSML